MILISDLCFMKWTLTYIPCIVIHKVRCPTIPRHWYWPKHQSRKSWNYSLRHFCLCEYCAMLNKMPYLHMLEISTIGSGLYSCRECYFTCFLMLWELEIGHENAWIVKCFCLWDLRTQKPSPIKDCCFKEISSTWQFECLLTWAVIVSKEADGFLKY